MVTFTTDPQNERYYVFFFIMIDLNGMNLESILCVVGKQRRTENTGMFYYYLFGLS